VHDNLQIDARPNGGLLGLLNGRLMRGIFLAFSALVLEPIPDGPVPRCAPFFLWINEDTPAFQASFVFRFSIYQDPVIFVSW
jgi:hypothetical protein